jgi:3-deoxy-D-manno-octulosonate 8-phosphate phosphatase (KDO 8-P phosphatase)
MLRDVGVGLVVGGLVVGAIGALGGDARAGGLAAGAMLVAAGAAAMVEDVRRGLGRGRARGAARFVKLAAELGIEGVVTDVDGTLTDGAIFRDASDAAGRSFSSHDGLGFRRLRDAGIAVGWLSATSDGASIEGRARMLGIEHIDWGAGDKGDRFDALCGRMGVSPARTVFMGDDVNDLPAMDRAGMSACPADAVEAVRAEADVVVGADGGRGALRELAELLLEAKADRERARL